jgi:hypothetical protein
MNISIPNFWKGLKTLDTHLRLPYNMGVINGPPFMSTAQETVLGIVIDVCTRSFLLISDQGSERLVECDTVEEFMNVLEVVTAQLDPEQIEYADLAVYGQDNN